MSNLKYFCRLTKALNRHTGSHLCGSLRIKSSNQSILAMRLLSFPCSNRMGLLAKKKKKKPVIVQQIQWISAYGNQFSIYRRIISQWRESGELSASLLPLKMCSGHFQYKAAVIYSMFFL